MTDVIGGTNESENVVDAEHKNGWRDHRANATASHSGTSAIRTTEIAFGSQLGIGARAVGASSIPRGYPRTEATRA